MYSLFNDIYSDTNDTDYIYDTDDTDGTDDTE